MTLSGSFGFVQQAGHVAHEDQAPGFEGDRRLRRGDVGVAVVDLAVLAAGGGADDGRDAFGDAFQQRGRVHADDLAHVTQVEGLAVRPLQLGLAATEDVRAGKAFGETAQRVDGGDYFRIDLPGEHLVGNLHGGFVGDALALEERGLEAGLLHGARDGFAAAVDDDRVDLDRLQEDNVTRDAVADLRVRRVHEAAAVLDDEGGAAEALDVGQRLQQGVGFGNEVLHGGIRV